MSGLFNSIVLGAFIYEFFYNFGTGNPELDVNTLSCTSDSSKLAVIIEICSTLASCVMRSWLKRLSPGEKLWVLGNSAL